MDRCLTTERKRGGVHRPEEKIGEKGKSSGRAFSTKGRMSAVRTGSGYVRRNGERETLRTHKRNSNPYTKWRKRSLYTKKNGRKKTTGKGATRKREGGLVTIKGRQCKTEVGHNRLFRLKTDNQRTERKNTSPLPASKTGKA